MTMKINLKTIFAAVLLTGMTALPLLAQTNANDSTTTNISASSTDGIPQVRPRNSTTNNFTGTTHNHTDYFPIHVAAMTLGIVFVVCYAKSRQHKQMNETLRAMIEKGMPITPELVASLRSSCSGNNQADGGVRKNHDLRNGLIIIGAGIGIVMLAGTPGWIVVFVGAAFLIGGMLEGKSNNDGGQSSKP